VCYPFAPKRVAIKNTAPEYYTGPIKQPPLSTHRSAMINFIFFTFVALLCILWCLMYLVLIHIHRHITSLHQYSIKDPQHWPRLSVIVPACNEANSIEGALHSLMDQDYPDLEIILVEDRSTDTTGKIVDRLAQHDSRVKVIHITELPQGWLGKVHALHQGTQASTGDWLLFTDADIQFAPGILRRAVAYSIQHGVDHLALLPGVTMQGFWLKVLIHTFGLLFLLSTRVDKVNRGQGKHFIGVGAFNLVKKEIFRKTPGFEWLRMEVVDDMGVGLLVKNAGGVAWFAMAEQDLIVHWYTDIQSMFRGLEKNSYGPASHYKISRFIWLIVTMLSFSIAPYMALLSSWGWLQCLGLLVIMLQILFAVFFVRNDHAETISLLLFPIGLILYTMVVIRAGYKCIANKGIDWRGTHYSINELKAGQRIKF